jgi:hypothetical protein
MKQVHSMKLRGMMMDNKCNGSIAFLWTEAGQREGIGLRHGGLKLHDRNRNVKCSMSAALPGFIQFLR